MIAANHPTPVDLCVVAQGAVSRLRDALGGCVPVDLELGWDLRLDMGSRAGLTRRLSCGLYVVELNPHAMLRMGPAAASELVCHEVAHAVEDAVLGWRHDVHGGSWRFLMALLGYPDARATYSASDPETERDAAVSDGGDAVGPRRGDRDDRWTPSPSGDEEYDHGDVCGGGDARAEGPRAGLHV